jgi:hypothetical protein
MRKGNPVSLASISQATPTDGLAGLQRFARQIPSESWFAALGDPLIEAEADEARLYLDGLGFTGAGVQPVADWAAARAKALSPDWDPAWWEAEERLRANLLAEAEAAFAEGALYQALTEVTTVAGDTLHGKAAVAASRAGVADPGLIRSAAGAAAMACYQAGLALAVGSRADQPFLAKYRLFAAGRWPLAINKGVLSVL